MKTLTLTLPKQAALTLWGISQERPYPDIADLRNGWRNSGGIFRSYSSPATGLSRNYRAVLLRPDLEPSKATGTRRDHAGYDGNPGTLTLRGRDLGEILIDIELRGPARHLPVYARIRVRGFEDPTPGENAWIQAEIIPALVAFIGEHEADLKAEAVAGTLEYMRGQIARVRETIAELEAQIETAVF